MHHSEILVRARTGDLLSRWPRSASSAYTRYLDSPRTAGGLTRRQSFSAGSQPYWLLVPAWLLLRGDSASENRRRHESFLKDILWGQYCLFRSVRITDDLLDGHVRGRHLHRAADLLLKESRRAFALHFGPRSPFWRFFESSLARTVNGIRTAAHLRLRDNTDLAQLFDVYPRVCAIFSVGARAVCLRMHERHLIPALERFCSAMARAGHLLDDLLDLKEDGAAGKFNAAMAIFMREISSGPHVQNGDTIEPRAAYLRAASKIFRRVHRELNVADRSMRTLRCREGARYIRLYRRSVDDLRRSVEESAARNSK